VAKSAFVAFFTPFAAVAHSVAASNWTRLLFSRGYAAIQRTQIDMTIDGSYHGGERS
jgi:hypothetical protein